MVTTGLSGRAGEAEAEAPLGSLGRHVAWIAVAAACVAGLVLRLTPRGPLWLDEAQSVSFARLPVREIPGALREDGAPPLYYVLLHGWMRVFGESTAAVRSLSIVASLAFAIVLTIVAHRLAGRAGALATAALVATNPFAIRYATEARMYALVMLEVALGLWCLDRALRSEAVGPRVGLALVTAALLYTHYWSLYLLAATAIALVAVRLRHPSPPLAARLSAALIAIAAGGVAWLPWWPTFHFQSGHTGTPWTGEAQPVAALRAFYADGRGAAPVAAGLTVLGAATVWFAARQRSLRRGLDARVLAAVMVGCLTLAVLGGQITHSAFVIRYAAVAFPIAVLLGGLAVGPRRWRAATTALLAVVSAIGIGFASYQSREPRTRAATLAKVLERHATDQDVIVYCPDQVGPALHRLLADSPRRDTRQIAYPGGSNGERVDWIGYKQRYAKASPIGFAQAVSAQAGPGSVWLVWSGTYPATQAACRSLAVALEGFRPIAIELLPDDPGVGDHAGLWRYAAGSTGADRPVPRD